MFEQMPGCNICGWRDGLRDRPKETGLMRYLITLSCLGLAFPAFLDVACLQTRLKPALSSLFAFPGVVEWFAACNFFLSSLVSVLFCYKRRRQPQYPLLQLYLFWSHVLSVLGRLLSSQMYSGVSIRFASTKPNATPDSSWRAAVSLTMFSFFFYTLERLKRTRNQHNAG